MGLDPFQRRGNALTDAEVHDAQGKAILILARDIELLGNILGRFGHRVRAEVLFHQGLGKNAAGAMSPVREGPTLDARAYSRHGQGVRIDRSRNHRTNRTHHE